MTSTSTAVAAAGVAVMSVVKEEEERYLRGVKARVFAESLFTKGDPLSKGVMTKTQLKEVFAAVTGCDNGGGGEGGGGGGGGSGAKAVMHQLGLAVVGVSKTGATATAAASSWAVRELFNVDAVFEVVMVYDLGGGLGGRPKLTTTSSSSSFVQPLFFDTHNNPSTQLSAQSSFSTFNHIQQKDLKLAHFTSLTLHPPPQRQQLAPFFSTTANSSLSLLSPGIGSRAPFFSFSFSGSLFFPNRVKR